MIPHTLCRRSLAAGLMAAALALFAAPQVKAQQPWMALIAPDNSFDFTFYKDLQPMASLGIAGWGPNWGWRSVSSNQRAAGDALDISTGFEADAGQVIQLSLHAWQSGPQSVSFRYTLSADRDVSLTLLCPILSTDPNFQDGQAVAAQSNGQQTTLPLSFGGIRGVPDSSQVLLQSRTKGTIAVKLDPPVPLTTDGALRIALAQQQFPKGTKVVTVTVNFPAAVAFLAKDSDLARFTKVLPGPDWFPFTPSNTAAPTPLSFADWLDKPAGKHGGVRMVGDHFQFEDGTPVKFFGTNLAYGASAPPKADAPAMAARFARWGVNAIRMHKFTGAGEAIGDPNDATKMTPDGLDRLDYFSAQLAKNGVYYGWSHTYHFHVRPGNRGQLLAYDEIVNKLGGDTYGFINLAEDVQNLMIQMVVNLLKHRNPYTGKTYAEDPALCYIELQNEDDIFFYTTADAINACPTYKQHFLAEWADWLKAKYGSTENLKKAWGDALQGNESIEVKNIALQGNPWFFGEDNLPKQTDGQRQRLLDNAAFLHDAQDRFYQRYVKAIRDAGYKGPLVGSPWQAPAMLPHLYNLHSDAMVGYIDRHDYFGGKLFDTMLTQPGSGYFSAGLQQVADRPFGLSEWIHVYPSLYSAEGPPIVAAYGLGLQGWDASYEFQSSEGTNEFGSIVGNFPWGVWNADVPTQIGQYPLLARMIQRGDVKEGSVISVRRVTAANLAEGRFNFTDKVNQQGDVKTFGGSTPPEALAAGRCLIEFTNSTAPSMFPNMARYRRNGVIYANNGSLDWNTSGQGYFTINSRGTKAVVGFAQGRNCQLGSAAIRIASPYASLFLTAAEKGRDLSNARTALISLVARCSNTGFSYFVPDQRVINNGTAPILMEPVSARITLAGRPIAAVNILDFDGRPTGRTVPVSHGLFTLDTGRDKAIYYQVVFAG